jgi:hypothetical protein
MAQDYCLVCQMSPLPGKEVRNAAPTGPSLSRPTVGPGRDQHYFDAKRRMWTFSSSPIARKLAISEEPP